MLVCALLVWYSLLIIAIVSVFYFSIQKRVGWCPRGRVAESGCHPTSFILLLHLFFVALFVHDDEPLHCTQRQIFLIQRR